MAISIYHSPISDPTLETSNHETSIDTTTQSDELASERRQRSPPLVDEKIAIRNRRFIYLQNHEEYFTETEHAFPLPSLYNQLVARFMTGRDRRDHFNDPTSQSKFSEILARDLERGEDRMAELRRRQKEEEIDEDELEEVEDDEGNIVKKRIGTTEENDPLDEDQEKNDAEPLDADILLQADADGEFGNIQNKEDAWEIWREILSRRFLRGDDEDFDYDSVDRPGGAGDPHHLIEAEIERDGWEEYFDGEEADAYVERDGRKYLNGKAIEGETGIQDF